MLSPETLEQYRRMTGEQRLELALEMIRDNLPALLEGPPDLVDRRFELLRRDYDAHLVTNPRVPAPYAIMAKERRRAA